MADAKIAGRGPVMVTLEPGEHLWCACGESKTQPYCDGSHQGSTFQPVKFMVETEKEAYLCMCKRTRTPPYCDGVHKTLTPEA